MNKAPTQYGEPAKNIVSDYVHQQYSDTCAIKSQQLVLEKYGIDVSEEKLRAEAYSHGWYSPGGGTSMNDVGKLLELHGIGVSQYVNGNIFNVINELAQGHNVIMGVDSGELWHYGLYEKIEDKVVGPRADHALIVSGINTEDPQNIKVMITDPGTGDLCKEYTLSQFVDAANDSNFFMVTTNEPEPHIFDNIEVGIQHLPYIGSMSYNDFKEEFAFLHDIEDSDLTSFRNHIDSDTFDSIIDEIISDDIDMDDTDLPEDVGLNDDIGDILEELDL